MKKMFVIFISVFFMIAFSGMANNIVNPDTVVYETSATIPSLDPAWAYDTASDEAVSQFYDNLIQYDGTSVTNFLPMLSVNVPSVADGTILDNGTTYIFHIRSGVLFHNGDELTPQDVVYSLERLIIFDRAGGASWMLAEALLPKINGMYTDSITQLAVQNAGVNSWDDLFATGTTTPKNEVYKNALIDAFNTLAKDFEIKGDEVIIHLPHPYPPFLDIIAKDSGWTSIMDQKWCIAHNAWDGAADDWWQYHNPTSSQDPLYSIENGTGPFELVNWQSNQLIFKRFDEYWNTPAKIAYGEINTVTEFTTRELDLTKGNADIIDCPVAYLTEVENVPGITVIKGFPTLEIDQMNFTWNINSSGNPYVGSGKLDGNGIPPDFFSNLDVRKAFEYLFPYKDYIEQAYSNLATQPNGCIPSGLMGYNPNVPPVFEQNLSKAKEYFQKAYDGQLWKNGFTFTAVYNTGNTQRQIAFQALSKYAEMVNPKFKIKVVGELWSSFLNDLFASKLPMYILGWTADYPDPYDFAFAYYSSSGTDGGFLGQNYTKWAKQYMDPLIVKSMETVDPTERSKLYEQMNTLAYDNALYIWIDQPLGVEVQRSWLKGWYYNPMNPGPYFYTLSK